MTRFTPVILSILLAACTLPSLIIAFSPLSHIRSIHRDPLTWNYAGQIKEASSSSSPSSSLFASSPYNWTTHFYTQQIVDHFGWQQTALYTQKYLINADHWKRPESPGGPGPIFFYCGNEGYIETFAGNSGFMFDIAEEFGALLLFAEHRYYGSSFPFGSADAAYANTSTLQYLTSEQALADFVQFLDWFKADPTTECEGKCRQVPVIGFGGSYGGMLAAWMRIKYPWALAGSIAASAPIWQFVGQVSPTVYNHIVSRDYTLDTPHCYHGIQKGWDIIDAWSQTKEGLQQLTDIFRPCNITRFSPETVGAVWGFLSEAFGFMAMADYPYEADFLGPMPAYPVSYGCKKYFMDVDPSKADNITIMNAVYGVANTFWNYTGLAGQCNDMNAQGPSTLGSQDGWEYTSQYGGDIDMFWPAPFDLEGYIKSCQAPLGKGGWGTTPRVGWIDEEYGGLHIEAASRIFFSSGGLDPWSGLTPNATAFNGIYGPNNPHGLVCYFMNNTAHHLDLRGRNESEMQHQHTKYEI